ncbi:MAG: hypothetical protein K0R18_303 [Bacillales bacterium]|jgi:hypothetical protein|nr:hypothetical protein [Bacillales bacterium]
MSIQLFAGTVQRFVEAGHLGSLNDLIVVYIRDGEPNEQHLIAYSGSTIQEKMEACAKEVDEVLYVVDSKGNQLSVGR